MRGKKKFNLSSIRLYWTVYFCLCPLTYLASGCWLIHSSYRWILSGLASLILSFGCARYLAQRSKRAQQEQLRILLEYLSGRLSAGNTLENALLEAGHKLQDQLGRKSAIGQKLQQLRQMLLAQVDLKNCLAYLQTAFPSSSSQTFFGALGFLRRYGGRLDIYVKESHRSITDDILLEKQIRADQSAKNSEALVLSILPFLLAYLLQRTGGTYGLALQGMVWSQLAYCFLYLAACTAACVNLLIVSISGRALPYIKPLVLSSKPVKSRLILACSESLFARLPGQLGFTLASLVNNQIPSHDQHQAWPRYIRKKLQLLALSFAGSILLLSVGKLSFAWLPLLILVLPLAQDLDLVKREQDLALAYSLEYPDFLKLCSILLNSGLTLAKSLELIHENIDPQGLVKRDLDRVIQKTYLGYSLAESLTLLANNFKQSDLISALHLIARYDQDGGREILDLLRLQATNSRQIYKDAVRKRLGKSSLLLTLPMGIDLLVIIITAILPALASFQIAV